jgi:hypothetical protein
MLQRLSDQVVQAHGQASNSKGESYEHKPCLEEFSLEAVHRSIIRQRGHRFDVRVQARATRYEAGSPTDVIAVTCQG